MNGEAQLCGRTILVVEDQPAPREAMVGQLSGAGASVIACASAEELDAHLAGVEERHDGMIPQLILLDLTLPGRSGLDALRSLRRRPAFRALPVVIVSGDDEASVIDEALTAGCQGFLTKPVRMTQLIATCLRVLR